jgi:hypothetical protein
LITFAFSHGLGHSRRGRAASEPGHAAESGSKFGHKNGMTLRKPFSAIAHCASLICPTGKICSIFLTIASDSGLFVAKSPARKSKIPQAFQSGLGCRFFTHKNFSFG